MPLSHLDIFNMTGGTFLFLSVFFFLYLFVFLSFIRLHSKWSSESSRETEPKKKNVLYGKDFNSRFDVASKKVSIRPKGDMFALMSWYTA
jgi:hypothetical protein